MITTSQQIETAYVQMAEEARYRPAAPSDGFGHITVPLEDLDLDAEARAYARSWDRDEDAGEYWVLLKMAVTSLEAENS